MDRLKDSIYTFHKQEEICDQSEKGSHASELYPYMLEEIRTSYAPVLLDLGCGSGELMKQVLDEDRERIITGLDGSATMLSKAYAKLHDSITLVKGNAQELPFATASFDMVYCNDSFSHYPYANQVIKEVHRVLKPKGVVLIGERYLPLPVRMLMNQYYCFRKEKDVHRYSKKELECLLSPYFKVVRCYTRKSHAIVIRGERCD